MYLIKTNKPGNFLLRFFIICLLLIAYSIPVQAQFKIKSGNSEIDISEKTKRGKRDNVPPETYLTEEYSTGTRFMSLQSSIRISDGTISLKMKPGAIVTVDKIKHRVTATIGPGKQPQAVPIFQ